MSPIRGRSRSANSNDRQTSDNSDSPSYKEKRNRNNQAVKKSRMKAKSRTTEMEGRVKVLKEENDKLQTKIEFLQEELERLKNTFINHADTKHGVDINPEELDSVLEATGPGAVSDTVQRLIQHVEGAANSSPAWR
ncbi:CCAAT/enhancer-binding protein gamma [Hyalella azteca]|uniref:CCAAT/enhancer-binding protein gamma n=2 Tax=Hyalella azteca TaxID=294128 RepID=A0A8B7P3Q4_HYAAZ|nr:CCAAT/enhancer-binding protein gamma [Hyalella azteca]